MKHQIPKVGIGVIVQNKNGEILIGKRIGNHATQQYSIPGGGLELGESFEKAAIRELKEEVGIEIKNPVVIAVTNNLETYKKEGIHFVSIVLLVRDFLGKPRIMEPDKFNDLNWYDPQNLPEPHFDASKIAIECYIKKTFYKN